MTRRARYFNDDRYMLRREGVKGRGWLQTFTYISYKLTVVHRDFDHNTYGTWISQNNLREAFLKFRIIIWKIKRPTWLKYTKVVTSNLLSGSLSTEHKFLCHKEQYATFRVPHPASWTHARTHACSSHTHSCDNTQLHVQHPPPFPLHPLPLPPVQDTRDMRQGSAIIIMNM